MQHHTDCEDKDISRYCAQKETLFFCSFLPLYKLTVRMKLLCLTFFCFNWGQVALHCQVK